MNKLSSRLPRSASYARAFTLLELLVVISIIAVLAGILLPVASGVMNTARKTTARTAMQSIVTAIKAYQSDYSQYPVDSPTAGASGASTPVDATFDKNSRDTGSGKYGRNGYLFEVLRGRNSNSTISGATDTFKALNPRRTGYFEAKDVKNSSAPRDGFIPSPKPDGLPSGVDVGDLVDPWGTPYYVRIDSNYSGKVIKPYPVSSESDGNIQYAQTGTNLTDDDTMDDKYVLRTDVIVWSAGKDTKLGDQSAGGGSGASKGDLTSNADDVVSWQQ